MANDFNISDISDVPTETCRVFNSIDQSIPDSVTTLLGFDSENFDTDGMHDLITNNSRITINTPGKYIIGCNIRFFPDTTSSRIILIEKNQSIVIARASTFNTGLVFPTDMIATTEDDFIVGDFVEVNVFQASGGALNATATTFSPVFWAHRLS